MPNFGDDWGDVSWDDIEDEVMGSDQEAPGGDDDEGAPNDFDDSGSGSSGGGGSASGGGGTGNGDGGGGSGSNVTPSSLINDVKRGTKTFREAITVGQAAGIPNIQGFLVAAGIVERQPVTTASGVGQRGAPPSIEDIVRTLVAGEITREAAMGSLVDFHKMSTFDANATIIRLGGGEETPTFPERATEPDNRLPGAVTGFEDEFEKFMKGLAGQEDISRRFVTAQNVAPAFRDAASGLVERQAFPFSLQALLGNIPGLDRKQFTKTPTLSFQDFLQSGGVGSLPGLSQTFSAAGNFLSNPTGIGGELGVAQQAIQDRLLNQAGLGTSSFFNPMIKMVADQQVGRGLGGFNIPEATTRSLQNQLAADPLRFKGVADFGSFLNRKGLIF